MRHLPSRFIAVMLGAILLFAGNTSVASATTDPIDKPPSRDEEQPTFVELESLDGGSTGSRVTKLSAPSARMTAPTETCSSTDGTGRQVCVEIGGELSPADARAVEQQIESRGSAARSEDPNQTSRSEVSASAVQPVPQWCLDFGELSVMLYTRTAGCGIYPGVLQVTRIVNGVPTVVGSMTFLAYRYIYTDQRLTTTWANQIQISPTIISGEALGTQIWGVATCTGVACLPEGQTFPTQSPALQGVADGESYFSWPVTYGQTGTGAGGWTVSFKAPTVQAPASLTYPGVPTVRCDQALPGSFGIGCVIPDAPAELLYDSAQIPEFGLHLVEAELSGLPGSWYSGAPLHRLTDPVLGNLNRNTACSPTLVRPAGKSCDEYPFRSTWEGAFTGGGSGRTFDWCQMPTLPTGITGSAGYSACMIDETENTDAGLMLQNDLYVPYRVLEGDAFYTTVM